MRSLEKVMHSIGSLDGARHPSTRNYSDLCSRAVNTDGVWEGMMDEHNVELKMGKAGG